MAMINEHINSRQEQEKKKFRRREALKKFRELDIDRFYTWQIEQIIFDIERELNKKS